MSIFASLLLVAIITVLSTRSSIDFYFNVAQWTDILFSSSIAFLCCNPIFVVDQRDAKVSQVRAQESSNSALPNNWVLMFAYSIELL